MKWPDQFEYQMKITLKVAGAGNLKLKKQKTLETTCESGNICGKSYYFTIGLNGGTGKEKQS